MRQHHKIDRVAGTFGTGTAPAPTAPAPTAPCDPPPGGAISYGLADHFRNQAETELSQLRRLREEAQQFAYAIAHDLKSPVNTLLLLFAELGEHHADRNDATGSELSGHCMDTLHRIKDTIETLLVMATQDAPAPRPVANMVDLAAIMREVRNDLAADIRRTDARIEGADDLPCVPGTAPQLRLVFQNLVSNAVKFHRPGVAPHVRLRCRDLMPPDLVAIEISDNGRGIASPWRRRIFDPLQRAAGVSDVPGTGLGLTLCQRIVKRHGGEIELHSVPGVGSTFTVILPSGAEDLS